jgi:hypothetical protein
MALAQKRLRRSATKSVGAAGDEDHQAIAACGGDARETVKALIVANGFLEIQLEELGRNVSTGYARGRLPRERERAASVDAGDSDGLKTVMIFCGADLCSLFWRHDLWPERRCGYFLKV